MPKNTFQTAPPSIYPNIKGNVDSTSQAQAPSSQDVNTETPSAAPITPTPSSSHWFIYSLGAVIIICLFIALLNRQTTDTPKI
jgi:hypothetical protein